MVGVPADLEIQPQVLQQHSVIAVGVGSKAHWAVQDRCAGFLRWRARNLGGLRLDDHGTAGSSVNLAFRLLEAADLKSALAETPGVLALILSRLYG